VIVWRPKSLGLGRTFEATVGGVLTLTVYWCDREDGYCGLAKGDKIYRKGDPRETIDEAKLDAKKMAINLLQEALEKTRE
jgi:hypothetical protein